MVVLACFETGNVNSQVVSNRKNFKKPTRYERGQQWNTEEPQQHPAIILRSKSLEKKGRKRDRRSDRNCCKSSLKVSLLGRREWKAKFRLTIGEERKEEKARPKLPRYPLGEQLFRLAFSGSKVLPKAEIRADRGREMIGLKRGWVPSVRREKSKKRKVLKLRRLVRK